MGGLKKRIQLGVRIYPKFLAYRTVPYRNKAQQTVYRLKNSAPFEQI
jgi:hypothetical protein